MFGIVFLHTVGQYGKEWWWLSSSFLWCVDGFAFISGWYGLRFKLSKILRLYGIVVFSLAIFAGVRLLTGQARAIQVFADCLDYFLSLWFIHAYVVLMALAPILDGICDEIAERKVSVSNLLPFFVCVFGWGFLTNFGVAKAFVPRPHGLTDFSAVTLAGVYLLARLSRIFEISPGKFGNWTNLLMIFSALFLATLKLGQYNSIVAVVISFYVFHFFLALRPHRLVASVCAFVAPSTFAIYVLHTNVFIFRRMPAFVDEMNGIVKSMPLAFLMVAVATFLTCLMLDMPRRLLARLFRRWVEMTLEGIDGLYMRICNSADRLFRA